ncbi:unnamed protein product, partial [Symbiodinium microadriaticum]
ALVERLARPSSPGRRVCERLAAWSAERSSAAQRECTFRPDLTRSGRSFVQTRAGFTAMTRERRTKVQAASSVTSSEPTFQPQTNPIHPSMRSAHAYLQQSVFRRLSQPSTPERPPVSRSFEGHRSLEVSTDSSIFQFLQRQNLCEEARRDRLERLHATNDPPLRPVLCERSLQLASRGRRSELSRSKSASPKSASAQDWSFTPKITKLARQREPRGCSDLGPGDQARRAVRQLRRCEESSRKEQKLLPFAPAVRSYQDVGSRLRVLEEPDTLIERVKRTREAALQKAQRSRRKEEVYPFHPEGVRDAPALTRRMAESHRALRLQREKENRSKVVRPAWQ